MKTEDFNKVVNAVINTINSGDSVAYVTGGQGGSGFGWITPGTDEETVKENLLSYDTCEEIDADDICADFDGELDADRSEFDFWQLTKEGDGNPPYIQLAIVPDNYEDDEEEIMTLADIAYKEGLDTVDTTSERNGYPQNVRSAIVGFDDYDSAKEIADKYDLSLIWIDKREGWHIWHRGDTAYGPMEISPEDFGANYEFEDDVNAYKGIVFETIEDKISRGMVDYDGIKEIMKKAEEVIEAIDGLEEGQTVVTYDEEYHDTIDLHPIYFCNDGKHTKLAAVK